MEELLNLNVKEVIGRFAGVGDILDKAGIGCVSCSVGTCRLKDVVGIHNLSPEQEAELFATIAAVVFPGRTMAIPRLERKVARTGAARLSPPVKELVAEHTCIKRVIALLPLLAAKLDKGLDDPAKRTVLDIVDFVRQFADRFHHAKEEDLLFKYLDGESDILKAMYAEHESGRRHIRAAVEGLERNDAGTVRDNLSAYGALLAEHIRKEDEILYPWMDRELTDSQVGRLYAQCREVEERFGDKPAHYRALVEELEERLGQSQKTNNSMNAGTAEGRIP